MFNIRGCGGKIRGRGFLGLKFSRFEVQSLGDRVQRWDVGKKTRVHSLGDQVQKAGLKKT